MPHMIKMGGNSCQDQSPHPHASSLLSLANSSDELISRNNGNGNFDGERISSLDKNALSSDEMIPEQREQDSNCGEQRQAERLGAKDSSLLISQHDSNCVVTNNLVTPTRLPVNIYAQFEMPTLPLLQSAGAATVAVVGSNLAAEDTRQTQTVGQGLPSVVKADENSSDKENNVSASDDMPSLTTSTGTSEESEAIIAENSRDTDKPDIIAGNSDKATHKHMADATKSRLSTGNNICYPNSATAHSPSHALSHMTASGCYYPPQTSPYPNHHPIMMGPPLHSHAPYPIHAYQNWPHHSYGSYPYGGYNGRGYSPQIPHMFSSAYSSQPPPSSVSPTYNNTKNKQILASTYSTDKNNALSKSLTKPEVGEKNQNSPDATVATVVGNSCNIDGQTGKAAEQGNQVTLNTERINFSPLQRRQDTRSDCDKNDIKEKEEGLIRSVHLEQNNKSISEKLKTVDTSFKTHLDGEHTEPTITKNGNTPKCDGKRHFNGISPDGNIDKIKTDKDNEESPQKKQKESKNQDDDEQQLGDSGGDMSKRFSSPGHVLTNQSFYPAHPHYMPPTQHASYPYSGMMPRYDQMHPYSGGGGFCGSYPGPPYPFYGSRFAGHMQGGWGNGGVGGPIPYPPYPQECSPSPNSKRPNGKGSDEGDGYNLPRNKIAGIAEHIERHQVLNKNATVGNDSSLSSQDINRVKSAERCVRMPQPHPTKFWSQKETNDTVIPDFQQLVNYPTHINKNRAPLSCGNPNQIGTRSCVMCGKERRCTYPSLTGRSRERQGKLSAHFSGCYSSCDEEDKSLHIIPRQNKGLCTSCDVAVWIVIKSQLEIKWCKGCKNFKPWAAFGDKGHATKCVRCRERQREKYANKKELMMKNRDEWKSKKDSDSDRDELKDADNSPKGTFSPRDHGGLSCLLAATAQVTSSLQQGV